MRHSPDPRCCNEQTCVADCAHPAPEKAPSRRLSVERVRHELMLEQHGGGRRMRSSLNSHCGASELVRAIIRVVRVCSRPAGLEQSREPLRHLRATPSRHLSITADAAEQNMLDATSQHMGSEAVSPVRTSDRTRKSSERPRGTPLRKATTTVLPLRSTFGSPRPAGLGVNDALGDHAAAERKASQPVSLTAQCCCL